MGKEDKVYNYLCNQIISGQYKLGDFLHEGEIAEACLVSRTPVRGALSRLKGEGIISTYFAKGSIVIKTVTISL